MELPPDDHRADEARSGREVRNRTFTSLRQEVVLSDDGRYVIYYSLPAAGPADASPTRDEQQRPPDQRPWAPDREPDV